MSHPPWQTARMKMKTQPVVLAQIELIATFGTARLIWTPSANRGRHELVGGSRSDHQAALEWCSLFHHDLVFSRTNPDSAGN